MKIILDFSKRYVFPLWRWYFLGCLALAATNYLTLEIPQFARDIINSLEHKDSYSEFQTLSLIIIGLGFLQILSRSLSRILIFWPGRKVEANAKSNLFEKIVRLPDAFYDRYGMGDLISRISNDLGQVRVLFAFGFLMIANLSFMLVFTISKMTSVHVLLTVACLSPLAISLALTRFLFPMMHKHSRLQQEVLGSLTNKVTEAFSNAQVIQANVAYDPFIKKADIESERLFSANMKVLVLQTVIFPLMTMLSGVSQLIVLFYGGLEVFRGALTIGDIMVFNVYIGYLAFPLSGIGIVLALFQRTRTSLERVNEVLSETAETPKIVPSTTHHPSLLEVSNLNFSYENSDSSVLKNISFSVDSGKHLGIFGPIGSGKTTLLNLISRIEVPEQGTIFFNGKDVLSIPSQELRQSIGFALQTPHLFSDSIENNLNFGLETELGIETLSEIADKTQILPEIERFRKGWQTQIGEKGVRLSGGQKQRLALSRLLLREPKVVLLDDVLSAVDQSTERNLIQTIHDLKCSMIIVSHRLSALKRCDEILFLKNGTIVDRGTFKEIYDRNSDFREEFYEND